jgi:poly-gamma-glutamate synthesis protein (capsule biosynthesis protein)
VDSGADFIIGHHPHVRQPAEIYQGKAIFYSLGNFIFDQGPGETSKGYAVQTDIMNGVFQYTIIPYEIIKTQPKFLDTTSSSVECGHILSNVSTRKGCGF